MIIDRCRNKQEFIDLYNSIDNSNLPYAEDILALGDYCLCFYDDDEFLGSIYLEEKNKKIFLNGFSRRKNYKNIIEGINTVCDYFKDIDIYSQTPFKHAGLVLKRSGFKQIDKDLYIRSKKNGK